MRAVLYVAARAPRPGFAKTRLGKAIGHDQAAILYSAFLRDLGARLRGVPFPVGWYVTPADAWEYLAPLVDPASAGCGHVPSAVHSMVSSDRQFLPGPVLIQGVGDWAARQQALFSDAPNRGEERTVLIASDSPHISLTAITDAFALLTTYDVVLGPVDDGGYYLIGMRGPWPLPGGVPMSTATVLSEIVARAHGLGLTVAFVEPTFDVDEASDLARLAEIVVARPDLTATRSALADLGWMPAAPSAAPTTAPSLLAGKTLTPDPCPLCAT